MGTLCAGRLMRWRAAMQEVFRAIGRLSQSHVTKLKLDPDRR
jgi:hypothetical protein